MVKVSLDAFAARDVEQARALHGSTSSSTAPTGRCSSEVLGYVQRRRGARVGDAPDHGRAVLRADRRQRGRHRRADRVPRDRRVRRVHRRVARPASATPSGVHHFATRRSLLVAPSREPPLRDHRMRQGQSTRGDGTDDEDVSSGAAASRCSWGPSRASRSRPPRSRARRRPHVQPEEAQGLDHGGRVVHGRPVHDCRRGAVPEGRRDRRARSRSASRAPAAASSASARARSTSRTRRGR